MFSMDTETIQSELLELLTSLRNMNPTSLTAVCSFLQHTPSELNIGPLTEVIQRASSAEIDKLISLTAKNPPPISLNGEENESNEGEGMEKLPPEILDAFNLLFQAYQLQKLLNGLSIIQLMKLSDIVPSELAQVQQLQVLEQLQQLLSQLLPETLASLHQEVRMASAGMEQNVLSDLLKLKNEHFHLYQPLRILLTLEFDDLFTLQDFFPKLQPIQMRQLLAFLQLSPYDAVELRRLLQTKESEAEATENLALTLTTLPQQTKRLTLKIVEQPPERSVYKRNLKPNPMVQLVGDADNNDSDLFVAPVLIRCDTLEEKNKLLTGNKPIKVAPGRVVVFKRLKITATSHQQGESLFAIKFELRRYTGEDQYEPLDFVQSNPICVLSHSTQLRPAASTLATITEVIPYAGSFLGGTRVAVLGNNFVDTPSARVRFDNTDVMPEFHGPRTLICVTPEHAAGIVSVRVSNDSKTWSPTTASFTYEERKGTEERGRSGNGGVNHQAMEQNSPELPSSNMMETSWQGGFETVKELGEFRM